MNCEKRERPKMTRHPSLVAYPFVCLGLRIWFIRGARIMDDEGELAEEPVSYLVGLLCVIGHGRWQKEFREWTVTTEQTSGR